MFDNPIVWRADLPDHRGAVQGQVVHVALEFIINDNLSTPTTRSDIDSELMKKHTSYWDDNGEGVLNTYIVGRRGPALFGNQKPVDANRAFQLDDDAVRPTVIEEPVVALGYYI